MMRVLIVANYYYPEEVGAGIWIRQLAMDLRTHGFEVTVLTSFPSYPRGEIFAGYAGRLFQRESIDGISIVRTCTYATTSKDFWPRILSFGSFCVSALLQGAWEIARGRIRADLVYAVLPPLPLGVSAICLGRLMGAKAVVNIQDIYPDIAVETGFLKSRRAVGFFRWMEGWIYRKAQRIAVISDGFRSNLLKKGVPAEKLSVIPNWADADAIRPMLKENSFREKLNSGDRFVVLYSGGFSHNSCLEPVIEAAALLSPQRFQFVFVGSGVKERELRERVKRIGLTHVDFLPFQPLENYPAVLACSDVTLVTLSGAATHASVPSKIFKQMAAGRAIIAVTESGNELSRLVEESDCGMIIHPADVAGLSNAIERLSLNPASVEKMGRAARHYIENACSRSKCVSQIENLFLETMTP